MSDAPKSALELVMERLRKKDAEAGVTETPLTDAQRSELERRITEDEANPQDVTSWEQIKASTLARLKK